MDRKRRVAASNSHPARNPFATLNTCNATSAQQPISTVLTIADLRELAKAADAIDGICRSAKWLQRCFSVSQIQEARQSVAKHVPALLAAHAATGKMIDRSGVDLERL